MINWVYVTDMFLSYGVSGYVLFKFMFELFQPKYERKVYIVSYFVFVLLSIIVNWINIPILKSFYGIVAICLIGILLFKSNTKKKLISACLFFFLYMFIIDTLSVLLFSVLSNRSMEVVMANKMVLLLCGLVNQVMLLCFYRPITALMKSHKFDSIALQQNIFLIILALFEILIIDYISIIIDNTSSSIVLTMLSIGFLGFDLYLIYLFEVISQKYKLEREIDLHKQQETMQRVYYNSIETQYENSRRLIHDMKNHIQTLEELYISGNIVEAGKYTSTIYENMDSMGNRFKCKNKILTIIINDKIRKSDKKGIVIKTDIEDINMEFMEPFDMTTIFSNLLDNAIEACEVIENDQKEISIRMFKYKDFMTIKIDNTYDMKIKKDGRLFLSTKEGLHMGLGLKNVESTIQKYDGSIYYNDGKNIFEVKILLPLDS